MSSGSRDRNMVVNDRYPKTTGSPPDGQPTVACAACGHPWAEHDQIAARFCVATTVGHHDRGCVCPVRTSVGNDELTVPKAGA